MKKNLTISFILNIFFSILFGYVIYTKGGIDYLKIKLHLTTSSKFGYDPYYYQKKSLFELLPNDKDEIIFLGNSITDGCEWSELFRNNHIKNRGIGGDVIDGVIERLDEVTSSNPNKIFLMIGINDLSRQKTTVQILSKYEILIKLIKKKSPLTQLYIQSILPTYKLPVQNNDIIIINKGLIKLTKKYNLIYVNLFDLVKTKNNDLDTIYSFDGLHLNGKGYFVWKKSIEKYVNN